MKKNPEKPDNKDGNEINPDKEIKSVDFSKTVHAKFLNSLSPHLRNNMEELLIKESEIIKRLEDPKAMLLFRDKPLEFFTKHKIELSPVLRKRLERFDIGQFNFKESLVLPNGTILSPKVKINIKIK